MCPSQSIPLILAIEGIWGESTQCITAHAGKISEANKHTGRASSSPEQVSCTSTVVDDFVDRLLGVWECTPTELLPISVSWCFYPDISSILAAKPKTNIGKSIGEVRQLHQAPPRQKTRVYSTFLSQTWKPWKNIKCHFLLLSAQVLVCFFGCRLFYEIERTGKHISSFVKTVTRLAADVCDWDLLPRFFYSFPVKIDGCTWDNDNLCKSYSIG